MTSLIERKPNSRQYRVVGKGVTVNYLAGLIDDPEWPLARICDEYDLTPAEVHAAWSFYYDHQVEIDTQLDEADARHRRDAEAQSARRAAMLARLQGKKETF